MKYNINNPKSEQKLSPFQRVFLFRPLQNLQDLQLIKTVFGCSENRLRNDLFWQIQQFYDWLQQNNSKYEQELIANCYTNINRQALFKYFLFNIEIQVSDDKSSIELIIPTSSQYLDKNSKREIGEQLLAELYSIYNCQFDTTKKQVDMLSSSLYYSLKNNTIQSNFTQFYKVRIIKIKIKKKCMPVRQSHQLVLQQNGDIIKSQFNKRCTITLSSSETFHNHKPFFSTHKYFAFLDRLKSFGSLNLNFDLYGKSTVYSYNQLIYEGNMIDGFLQGYGKFYSRETLIYEGSFSDNMLHGQGTVLHQYGYMKGSFKNDMMHGQFVGNSQIHFFERDIEVRGLSQDIIMQDSRGQRISDNSTVAQKQICTYKDYYVHTKGYRTFHPGNWIFETMVDYFIEYFYNQEKRKGNLQTLFYNTDKTNDFLNQRWRSNTNQRQVFAHNCNNSHFLLYILDQGYLYVCDSLYCIRPELELKFCKLLGLRNSNAIRLKCTQQQNGYDCGIFASYYALTFMKNEQSMSEVEKKLTMVIVLVDKKQSQFYINQLLNLKCLMSKLFFQDFLSARTKSIQERRRITKTQQDIERVSERKISETFKSNDAIKLRHEKQLQEYQQKNVELIERVSYLEVQNTTLQYELETAKLKLETITATQHSQASQQIQILKDQVEGLQKYRVESENYKNQVSQLRNDNLHYKNSIEELTDLNNHIKMQLKDHKRCQQQLDHSQSEFYKLTEKFTQFETMYHSKMKYYEELQKQFEHEQQREKYQHQELLKKIGDLENQNQQLYKQLQISKYENDVKQKQALEEQKQIKQELSKTQEEYKLLEKSQRTLKIERKTISDSQNSIKSKVSKLENELNDKEQIISKLEKDIDDKITIIHQLENIAYGLKQSAEEGKENTNQTLLQYKDLMRECDQLEQQIARLEQDNDIVKKEYESVLFEIRDLQMENQQLQEKQHSLSQENQQLSNENENLQLEIQTLNQRVVELQQYAVEFQRELKDHIEQQSKINQQRSFQNSQYLQNSASMSNQRNSFNSVQRGTDESSALGNQSPISNQTTTANQLKKLVKQQCVEGSQNQQSVENTKRHQARTDHHSSKIQTDRQQYDDQQKENCLQILQDKYYALRNRIYEQKK